MKYQDYKIDTGRPEATFSQNETKPSIKSKYDYEDYLDIKYDFEQHYEVSKQEWYQLEDAFEECLRSLLCDKKKINKTANALNWRYYNTEHPITVKDVVKTARYIFQELCKKYNGTGKISTGGVTVRSNAIIGEVEVYFAVSETLAYWNNELGKAELC